MRSVLLGVIAVSLLGGTAPADPQRGPAPAKQDRRVATPPTPAPPPVTAKPKPAVVKRTTTKRRPSKPKQPTPKLPMGFYNDPMVICVLPDSWGSRH